MNKMKGRKTNPRLTGLISLLKNTSRENEVNIWGDIADRLEAPAVNGETIIVPGKVLGSGMLQTPVKVAALNFSQSASEKIRQADGECMSIEDLITTNPKGSRVRILR